MSQVAAYQNMDVSLYSEFQGWKPQKDARLISPWVQNDKGEYEFQNPWDIVRQINKEKVGKDASPLSAAELTALQGKIMNFLRWQAKSQFAIETKNIGPGLDRVEYNTNADLPKPQLTKTLGTAFSNQVTRSSTTVELYGLQYEISLDKLTLDAGMRSEGKKVYLTPDIRQNNIDEFTAALIQARDWHIFRGTDAPGMTDMGIKGICNYSGVNTVTLTDTDLTTAGDVVKGASQLAYTLIQDKWDPPFELFMTPGVFSQAIYNMNATSSKTDLELIGNLRNANGVQLFNEVKLCPYLINSETETTSTGSMLAIKKLTGDFNYVAESYPLALYPLVALNLGWAAKLAWFGGVVLQRPTAVAYTSGLTTNTIP